MIQMKTARIIDESVITHVNEIDIKAGRAPKVDFRVLISFEDDDGVVWQIDRVYKAVPKKKAEEEGD